MKAKQIGFFLVRELKLSKSKYERWPKIAKELKLSKKACQRLSWMIYYETEAKWNTQLTCRHFDIPRSIWYYWRKRFDEKNLRTLEDEFRAPKKTRQKEYTDLQYERIVLLRKKHIRYGKVKLLKIYKKKYPDDKRISDWKIQCIIEISGLYYNAKKQSQANKKRQKAQQKKRITELKKKPKTGYLVCLDTIVRYCNGQKRYILTAIDKYAKVAYARMYNNHSSLSAKDFLERLSYLLDGKFENLQTDNGSEFLKHFEEACNQLKVPHYFSRTRTPKDNSVCERFNRTLQEEFIALGNMTTDIGIFNRNLTDWLIEYNFNRPHQTLDYLTPIEFTQKYSKVSKMYSSNTKN
jgi:transposase InsO family protein